MAAATRAVPYFYGSSFTLLIDLNRTQVAPSPFWDQSRRRLLPGAPAYGDGPRRLRNAGAHARATLPFRRFRFTDHDSLAMIGGKIIPQRIQETAMSQAMGSLMRVAVLAGALAFSSGATAQTAPPQTLSLIHISEPTRPY